MGGFKELGMSHDRYDHLGCNEDHEGMRMALRRAANTDPG